MSKVSIVTGGAGLIGRTVASKLLAEGHRVVIADNNTEKGLQIQKAINNANLKFINTDISNEESVKSMIEETVSRFGTITCLINNGALANPYFQSGEKFEDVSVEEWNKFLNVNLTSVFLCTKYALPTLRKSKQSSIINISSTRYLMSEKNTEGYAATKGGVVSMTHSLANSLSPDIRVNCISPGWIADENEELRSEDHEQHLVGRVGIPNDIAQMVLFLSDEQKSGFVTGQNFVIDGGMTKKMIYKE
ncbi:oxidoreductase [Acrasis kona]|uniref:Oxidoreductase n=1 Tax=Acrasis kona TaxID=1008807 RepID=A0AAW2YMB2_9EUKA